MASRRIVVVFTRPQNLRPEPYYGRALHSSNYIAIFTFIVTIQQQLAEA
jgi:hypothetical protein